MKRFVFSIAIPANKVFLIQLLRKGKTSIKAELAVGEDANSSRGNEKSEKTSITFL